MKKILLFSVLALFFVAPVSLIKAQATTQTVTTQTATGQMLTIADIKAVAPQLLQTLSQLSVAIGNKQSQIQKDQTNLDQVINNVSNIISLFSNLVSTIKK